MVPAPREELEQKVNRTVSAVVDQEPRGSCSPDLETYWREKRAEENWSAYVNRINTRVYHYGLSYENGC